MSPGRLIYRMMRRFLGSALARSDRGQPEHVPEACRSCAYCPNDCGRNRHRAVVAATGTSKTMVWRWKAQFKQESVRGLLRDKSRPLGKAPIADDRAAKWCSSPSQRAPGGTRRCYFEEMARTLVVPPDRKNPLPLEISALRTDYGLPGALPNRKSQYSPTSTTAWAKACGASWGRLCPTSPLISRCVYIPENLLA